MATFTNFPFDILFEICQHLDFRSVLNLAATCRQLRDNIDPVFVTTHTSKVDFFLEAEQFSQHKDPCRLACFRCWHILPKDRFGKSQNTLRLGKNSTYRTHKSTRFCWDCGAKDRLYPEQRGIRKGAFLWYLCYECGEYKLKSQRCTQVEEDEVGNLVAVRRCGKLPKAESSGIEELPMAVQKQIFNNLHYVDCIRLSQTNRYFNTVVSPQQCSLRDKFLFVRHKAHQLRADSLPCYSCFRVQNRQKFTPAHQQFPRKDRNRIIRKCRACLSHLHQSSADGHLLLEKLNQVEYCFRCRELKYLNQECPGCYERYSRSLAFGVSRDGIQRERKAAAEQYRLSDIFKDLVLNIAGLWTSSESAQC